MSDSIYMSLSGVYNACGLNGDTCSGTVDGVDLTGWRWANQSEVNSLVSDLLGIDFDNTKTVITDVRPWFNYFNQTGTEALGIFTIAISSNILRETVDGIELVKNRSSTTVTVEKDDFNNYELMETGNVSNFFPFSDTSYIPTSPTDSYYPYGFYFVKGDYIPPTVSAVPLPASALLLAPALLGFIGFRRKQS